MYTHITHVIIVTYTLCMGTSYVYTGLHLSNINSIPPVTKYASHKT